MSSTECPQMTNDNKSETGQPSLPRTVGPAIAVGQERVAACILMMGYKMSEQAASLRMPLYIYAFKQNSRTIVNIISGKSNILLLRNVFRLDHHWPVSMQLAPFAGLRRDRRWPEVKLSMALTGSDS